MTTQEFSVEVVAKASEAITGAPISFPTGPSELEAHVVEVAPGGSVGRHRHPEACVMYVLEGTIIAELDDGRRQTFDTGEVFIEEAGVWVSNSNPGPSTAKFFAVVVGTAGEPKIDFAR